MYSLDEAFESLETIAGEEFTFDKEGAKGLADFLDTDVVDDTIEVIDSEATTEEELQDKYVGNVILDCCVCHSKVYKNKDEIIISEDDDGDEVANMGDVCPHCHSEDGYKIVGEVAKFEDDEEDKEEEHEEEHSEEEKNEEDDELDEALKESLKEPTTARDPETGESYHILPVWADEKLVTIVDEAGDKTRMLIGDLYDAYDIYDGNDELISARDSRVVEEAYHGSVSRKAVYDKVMNALKGKVINADNYEEYAQQLGYDSEAFEDILDDMVADMYIRGDNDKFVYHFDESLKENKEAEEYIKTLKGKEKGKILCAKTLKPLGESKQLNEGPGAGYSVSGVIRNVKIKTIIPAGEGQTEYTNLKFFKTDIDADFTTIVASSYYYNGYIKSAPISIYYVSIGANETEEYKYEDWKSYIQQSLERCHVKVTLGGGWSHSTFDGAIEAGERDIDDGSSDCYAIHFDFKDKADVEYIDKAVTGDNIYETYVVYDEDGDVIDGFEKEEEAIESAKKYRGVKVVKEYEIEDRDGNIDFVEGDREVVWERDYDGQYKYDESIKESRREDQEVYVEYKNGEEFDNGFFSKAEYRKLKQSPNIKILKAKIADKKADKWVDESCKKESVKEAKGVKGPRGWFEVSDKTEDELKNDGWGFHHDFEADGKNYKVYAKNNEAVAVLKESLKEGLGDEMRIYMNTWANYNENGADLSRYGINSIADGWLSVEDAIKFRDEHEEDEPFINDYENVPFKIDENDTQILDRLLELEESDIDWDIVGAIVEDGYDIEDAIEKVENGDYRFYPGVTSDEDLGYAIIDEIGSIGDALGDRASYYIDEQAMRRDYKYDVELMLRKDAKYAIAQEEYIDEDEVTDEQIEEYVDKNLDSYLDSIIEEEIAMAELGEVDLSNYFDYEAFGRNCRFDGYLYTDKGAILVEKLEAKKPKRCRRKHECKELSESMKNFAKSNKFLEKKVNEALDKAKVEVEDNTVNVEKDDSKVNVTEDGDKITIEVEKKTDEVIAPLDNEDKAEIEMTSEENEAEQEEDEVDMDVTDFDNDSFDTIGEGYLKRVYENVDKYHTTKSSIDDSKVVVEGIITFKSGAQKKTSFIFEAGDITSKGKLRFFGENAQISNGKKTFSMSASSKDKKIVCESMSYNYRTGKGKRVFGTVHNK